MADDILSQALALGLPCFPCQEGSKIPSRPKSAGGRGFLDATDDPNDIRELWKCWPGGLIGVPTGAVSGVDVIDVDSRNGGHIWYAANKHKLPTTRINRTRSGGLHVLLAHMDGLRNSAGRIAPGVDVRADGGYIIWWPAAGFEFSDYPPSGIPTWPLWLLPALMTKPTPPPPPYHRRAEISDSLIEAKVNGIIRRIAGAREGERNNLVYWGYCRIKKMEAGGELDASESADVIAKIVNSATQNGLPAIEALRTVRRHG